MSSLRTPPIRWMMWCSGFLAMSAWFGVAGLTTGYLSLTPGVVARLPLHSPVLAALGLLFIVAGPSTTLTVMARHRDTETPHAAVIVGSMLVGWIVLELLLLDERSLLQLGFGVSGALLALTGWRLGRRRMTRRASYQSWSV